MTRVGVPLVGGPHDGLRADLTNTPDRILIGGALYVAIIDPDTGVFLGGYAHDHDVSAPR